MHITYGDKGVFVDEEAATVLFDYAAYLADSGRADTVHLNAIGPDGHEVVVTYLLDQGSSMMKETADAAFVIPDNSASIGYMRERINSMSKVAQVEPVSGEEADQLAPGFDAID